MCGQMVRTEAKKCRYCGYWFDATAPAEDPAAVREREERERREQEQRDRERREQEQRDRERREQEQRDRERREQEQRDRERRDREDRERRDREQREWEEDRDRRERERREYMAGSDYPGAPLITVGSVLSEGLALGMKNFFSIFLAFILYALTVWIPYLNVGTTIAMASIPITLSKKTDSMISPTFIFDGKYRKYMGEFFNLLGLMFISLVPAFAFMIVPGIIIAIGWSLAIYLMIDKEISPSESMIQSTKATYGYKWTIFLVSFIISVASSAVIMVVMWLLGLVIPYKAMAIVSMIVMILYIAVVGVFFLGCSAVIYRELSKRID